MQDEIRLPIRADTDIVIARQHGRELAKQLGFSTAEQALIATAISELARNVILYATHGEIILSIVRRGDRQGLSMIIRDEGPGIADLELAMQDGYSTSRGLGLGLPGARRLMDEFEVQSEVGKGTTVLAHKWLREVARSR